MNFKTGDEVIYFCRVEGELVKLEGKIVRIKVISTLQAYYEIDTMPSDYLSIADRNVYFKATYDSPLSKALEEYDEIEL